MSDFLDHIAEDLHREYGDQLLNTCLVVPTRRAVIFLQESLSRAYGRPIWAPDILPIQDMVRKVSGQQFPDTLPLVFELYQAYGDVMRQSQPNWSEPFEQFYPWGEMLVRDFDEVDKYCVDARQLFTNISDLREIDDFFALEGEALEAVRSFWKTLRGVAQADDQVRGRFLKIWAILEPLYAGYRARLAARHQAYDGMVFRQLADDLQQGVTTLPWERCIFIGFNALSEAEERIMHHLLLQGQATVYWDVDRVYFTPPGERPQRQQDEGHIAGEEPGKFILTYHRRWAALDSRLVLHDMGSSTRDLYLTGVPLGTGQAAWLGNLLRELPPAPGTLQRHAIVLADENLLYPVLYALPEDIRELNITMGFPLRQTHIYHLLMALMQLLRNQRTEGIVRMFSHQDVTGLLANPYIRSAAPEITKRLTEDITRQNLIFVPEGHIRETPGLPPLLHAVFNTPTRLTGEVQLWLDYLNQVFLLLLADARQREARIEAEYIFQFYTWFNQLQEVLSTYRPQLSPGGFAGLFREALQKARIPFEGEPLQGIQLMGFLETRVLDFEVVYILAANEGYLPNTASGNSFIPLNLRKGFGLPTSAEKDAIYAYHFYRLIQRARTVHLIYDSVTESDGEQREESRFIRQLRYFFRHHPTIRIHERTVSAPSVRVAPVPIRIEATDTTRAQLIARYVAGEGALSPSALTTWRTCGLQFYFRYLLGLREAETVEETMESNTFGSILHLAMELLYRPYIGVLLTPGHFGHLRTQVEPALEAAFAQHNLDWHTLRGKNALLRNVLTTLCQDLLIQDASSHPFRIEALEAARAYEHTIPVGGQAWRLSGTLDRVDYLPDQDCYRIVDYKTGRVTLPGTGQNLIAAIFTDKPDGYKEAFQGLMYAWLYRQQYPERQVQVGFYVLQHRQEGMKYLRKEAVIPDELLIQFEQEVSQLITHLREGPYEQTPEVAHCVYCPYNVMCNRTR
ncbi:MAG: PD-(D/E)XK nuclease family protein [Bacteroidia bacterium]|nr:PD-(D/E)XK nuclease family protein [Bacteroidia bacterium]